MTSPHRPSTPLRRISRGSIPALRQSQSHIDASGLDDADNGEGSSHHHLLSSIGGAGGALGNLESPLAFMKAAMGDLDHETSILQSNLEAVNSIHAALAVFDENFSMYLYGLKMNAFCVEWAEAPTEENFQRAEQTQDVLRAQRQQQSSILAGEPLSHLQSSRPDQGQLPASGEGGLADAIPPQEPPKSASQSSTTASGPSSQSRASQAGPSAAAAPKKVGAKGQITIAQKKQRIVSLQKPVTMRASVCLNLTSSVAEICIGHHRHTAFGISWGKGPKTTQDCRDCHLGPHCSWSSGCTHRGNCITTGPPARQGEHDAARAGAGQTCDSYEFKWCGVLARSDSSSSLACVAAFRTIFA